MVLTLINTEKETKTPKSKIEEMIFELEDILLNSESISQDDSGLWMSFQTAYNSYGRTNWFSEEEEKLILNSDKNKAELEREERIVYGTNPEYKASEIAEARGIELFCLTDLLNKRAMYGGKKLTEEIDFIVLEADYDRLLELVGFDGIFSNTVKYLVAKDNSDYYLSEKDRCKPNIKEYFSEETKNYALFIACASYLPVFILGVVPQIEKYLSQSEQNYMQLFAFFGPIIVSLLGIASIALLISSIVYGIVYATSKRYLGFKVYFYSAVTFWSLMIVIGL